jgi:hypothetical protein
MKKCWLVAFLCVLTAARAQDSLTGSVATTTFDIRFRPGSRAEAHADRVAALVEGDLARILAEVGVPKFPGRIRLCLYDDVAELQRVTGVPSASHSVPLCSHVPCDNDQTRVHELVHVVAERFKEKGPERRNLFVAEGLANAVLRFVDGVHVDCVAAFHRQRGDLPGLAEIHALDDFYGWLQQHPFVDSYDIAGSWVRFLLDEFGAEKVRRYYRGVPIKDAFGKDLAALEAMWHKRLEKVAMRDGTRRVLQQRFGRTPAERDPDAADLATVLEPASAWQALGADKLRDVVRTTANGGAVAFELDGKPNEGDWCEARFDMSAGDAAVRCTAKPGAGCFGVKIQLGGDCQAMVLRDQGAFLYCRGSAAAHMRGIPLGETVQIVLRRRGDRAAVFVDGKLVLEGAVDGAKANVGIGCVGGPGSFEAVAARAL